MHSYKYFIIVVAIMSLAACGGGGGSSTSIDSGAETVPQEAAAQKKLIPGKAVVLSWSAPTSKTDGSALSMSELAGFRIYVGTSRADMVPVADINDAYATRFKLTGLAPGSYVIGITAYTQEGYESELSRVAWIRIVPA